MLKRLSTLLCCLVPGLVTAVTYEINSGASANGYCSTASATTPASSAPTFYMLGESSGAGYCRAFDGIGGRVGMSQFSASVTGFIIGLGNGGAVFNAATVDLYTTSTNSVSVERYRAGVLVGTESKAVTPADWSTITLNYTNVDRVWIRFAAETAYANRFDLTPYVAPGVTVSAISGTTTEAGGTATFTVALNTQPTADVTIGLSSSDTNEGTVAPSSVTFTNANWATPQTVTVTGVDDAEADGSVIYSIATAAAVSADGSYNGVDAADVAVTNADNDVAGITVSTISGPTSEAGTSATFSVVLNTQPSGDVVVGLTSSDTTEGTVTPASLTFTNANWNVNQTATVIGVDDSDVDGDISYSIATAAAVSADGNYNGLDATDVNVTNTDNDVAGTDSNGDGILDSEASGIGLEADDADADTDGDGISDVAEVGDPNNPTDSDGDGIIDALEPGADNNDATVLSAFVTSGTAQGLNLSSLGDSVLAIRSTGGGTLTAHPNGSRGIPLYNETDMLVPDAQFAYPFGLVDFSVTSPSGIATIVIQLPSTVTIPANAVVRKLSASNQWVTFNAAIDREAGTITFTLRDNDAFDRDPTVGVIRDPVGIATYTGGGGGGGCVLSSDSDRDLSMLLIGAAIVLIGGWRRYTRH